MTNSVSALLTNVSEIKPQQIFKADTKAQNNDRFKIVDKPAAPHGCTYLLDMVKGLKEFKSQIQKEDFTKYTGEELNKAYLALKSRVSHMQLAIESSSIFKRIWLALAQFFTCNSLKSTWNDVEKKLIPAKNAREACFSCPKPVYDKKLIQPDDNTVTNDIHAYQKKLAAFVTEFNKVKTTQKLWEDTKFNASFDALWKDAVKLSNKVLDMDFTCTLYNWQNKKIKEAKDDAEKDKARKLTAYDMLVSDETYLTSLLKDLSEIYRYARFAATDLEKNKLAFAYSSADAKEDDYIKLFFTDKTPQFTWRTDFNSYVDRLTNKLIGLDANAKNFWVTGLQKDLEPKDFKDFFDAFDVKRPTA